jgi:hypothetical protein
MVKRRERGRDRGGGRKGKRAKEAGAVGGWEVTMRQLPGDG